ncbi:hypothetical protein HY989_00020 [Candidatus Micrarchaeota archaeon]|nr:hypothetical protein [Candidatus Micrarchaeota archaeon]
MAPDVLAAKESKFVSLQEKKSEEKKEADAKEVAASKEEKARESTQKGKGDKAKAEKATVSKDEPKAEKKREIILERIFIVPLSDAFKKPAMQRSNYAIKFLKKYLTRHMKAQEGNVKISLILNNFIRKRGSGRPVKKIKIKATKDKEGIVIAETVA